ncbi:MAG: hypothetical protein HOP33_09155 [Verrucomicrobia bacterium]|nr:hypothetical protein [Verrucomicrobiota bacterium]
MNQEDFIELATGMNEWSSLVCDPLRLTVHRFPDNEWWALWHTPHPQSLGRILSTPEQLREFLKGKADAGKVLAPQTIT